MRCCFEVRQIENPSNLELKLAPESKSLPISFREPSISFGKRGWASHGQAYLAKECRRFRPRLKRRLMEILACPIDKHYPLELHVFEEKEEITEGLLVCTQCDRWYPISDEIPQMLPDDLREAKEDLEWLRKWKERIPERVLAQGKPFRLDQ